MPAGGDAVAELLGARPRVRQRAAGLPRRPARGPHRVQPRAGRRWAEPRPAVHVAGRRQEREGADPRRFEHDQRRVLLEGRGRVLPEIGDQLELDARRAGLPVGGGDDRLPLGLAALARDVPKRVSGGRHCPGQWLHLGAPCRDEAFGLDVRRIRTETWSCGASEQRRSNPES